MANYQQSSNYGQTPPYTGQPPPNNRPPITSPPMGYQQPGSQTNISSQYGQESPYHYGQQMHGQELNDANVVAGQLGGMSLGGDPNGTVRSHRKKDRHAYHNIDSGHNVSPPPASALQANSSNSQFATPSMTQQWTQQPSFPSQQPQGVPGTTGNLTSQLQQNQGSGSKLSGTPASSTQGAVNPEQIPSVPWSRDAPAQFYLNQVYPTMEQHLPPPASVPFVAIDQGNSSPKYARLTLNNIPTSAEALNSTALPLGLVVQPLAAIQDGEQPVPVIDFGEAGPPRCRRCRTYINPFMSFRSAGNKYVCNMCTFPNDTPPEYYAPTDPSGARVDRLQRPELTLGTVEFAAPREYWTKEPVAIHWLFLIDVSMEAVSKGFIESFCAGILHALYHEPEQETEDENEARKTSLPTGIKVGIATFDKEIHFYNLNSKLTSAQMNVMPDLEEPFLPISEGVFVDPMESKHVIESLLNQLPYIFSKVKSPEPALLPALNTAFEALAKTGGKIICSLSSLPTWGPGRLFLREKPEMRDTEAEKKLFTTEHPGFTKIAKQMTEAGVGVDFFLAAPQGGYLDIATIGFVAERTGGETYYYPNFHPPRDGTRLSKEVKRAITRDTGFQALLKVRCSNGLQVSGYYGNFTQHTFGADLEFGAIDSDKAFGVTFSYDGKLDSKNDAHFQTALLYTTATGQRRIRCSNIVAGVSENAMESMKLVDQDAVIGILAKQAAMRTSERLLKDLRNQLSEKTIDILAAYRKNFSGSHPPGQLVLPENLKEFSMYMLGLVKSRALKAGHEPTDRRINDMRLLRSMGLMEMSLYLYPRIISIHNLNEDDGFPNENGYLKMPPMIRASYSRVDEGGAYLVDNGQICLLWIHAQVSPNLLEDLFGEGKDSLQALDPFSATIPVLETHLNAQVRNIIQYLEDNRGSKGLAIQLARQGLDGAEYEFARLLYEDRNNDAQSYVDWLVHLHRHIQMELQGQRRKEDTGESSLISGLKAGFM